MRRASEEDVRVVIVDRTDQSKEVVRGVANALERQAMEHLGDAVPKGWGVSARVRAATPRHPAMPHEWPLYLLPASALDVKDALGYHDKTSKNLPVMKVFPELDAGDGMHWSVTASHELLETLVDPFLQRCIQSEDGKIWSLEVCDPVEADTYSIDGVMVSNFALPAWYEPSQAHHRGADRYDFLGKCKAPYEVRTGGYAQFLSKQGWKTITEGKRRSFREKVKDLGRSSARARPLAIE